MNALQNNVELIEEAKRETASAMEKLVESNQGLIWSIVRRFCDRGYDIEDLFQIGAIGLIKAIKNYNASYNTQLSTYAVPMIIGEIKRFLRDDGIIKVSRHTKEMLHKVKQIRRESEMAGNEATVEDLAKKLNVSKEEIAYIVGFELSVDSLDREFSDDDETHIGEKIAANGDGYNDILNRIEIEKGFKVLSENARQVMYYRFFKDKKQSEIANLLGVTQVQISRIEKRALLKMRSCLSK